MPFFPLIAPSTSTSPYLLASEPNVRFTSIVTVGDALPGGGVFGGIPDGLGAFDNGDGTITVLVNHELRESAGIVRDHGAIGAYVDRLVIDKTTLAIVSSDDLIQSVQLWNDATDSYFSSSTNVFNRLCSSDLPEVSAFYNAASNLGTQTRIYLTGEESGSEGRGFATIVTGANAGTAFELPSLGNLSYENAVANPFAQDKTIVAVTDDGLNGQVYLYIGQKQATGSEIAKAGLTNGDLYGIKVSGVIDEVNGAPANGTFTLQEMGAGGDVSNLTGAQLDAESEAEGVTSFLRPEDSAWDPQHPNVLYFVTTNSFTGNSRQYQATFIDITNPQLGGTIVAVLDGSEGQKMFDNISVADGKVILQEDPGNQSYVAKIWSYDIASDTLTQIAGFDPALFTSGAPGFITQD
ncbi:MAG: PhoX family protein [Sphingomonas bacterium]|nr:PhoX family protein [Sphingomonas bacterium]